MTGLTDNPQNDPYANSLPHLLKRRAAETPAAVAITAPGRTALTYENLLRQVERSVSRLRLLGLNRNDRVAVVMPNGPEMAVAFVAVTSGATCAPLNPSYRKSEFDFYMTDLQAKALIILSGMDSPAREVASKLGIRIIEFHSGDGEEAGIGLPEGTEAPPASIDFAGSDDIALLLHTSGTTSRPKIVPLSHANILRSGRNIAEALKLTPQDRCLNVMPLFHIHGLIGAVLSSLVAGGGVVCTQGFEAERFFACLDTFQPTWYTAVPTMHQAILTKAEKYQTVIVERPLRFIRSCSASLPASVMEALETVFNAPVIESYGMTEASHQMTSNPLPPLIRKAGSVGIPAGVGVGVMDEAGNLLKAGETGEIVIRGANVTAGYENNQKANESAFTNGWFRTGDQGRFDQDGYLFITGRLKELINRGGEKIAPREVDEVLMLHPAVAQAVAFAAPHETLGEDVAAAVVLHPGESATENEIRAFAAAQLAPFKVPSQVLFVEQIPKGPTGKLQRIGLAEKLSVGKKAQSVPAGKVEKELVEIWRKLLRLEEVGKNDSFYALGGDSLLAAEMLAEIERRFDIRISMDEFFGAPTIVTIDRMVSEKNVTPSLSPSRLEGQKRYLPTRDPLWTGLKNRFLQILSFVAPGNTTTRVALHRLRGVSIGKNVSIGMGAMIETAYPKLVFIGNNVTIGIRAIVIGHMRDFTELALASGKHTVRIEDDVYIGPGSIILPNVIIGEGSVVSAGSVVSRSVPPHTFVQGNPARPIAKCKVSLGSGESYHDFLCHLEPIQDRESH